MSQKTDTVEMDIEKERIIEELVENQGGDIVDAIKELIQNGLDAPGSSKVEVKFDEHEATVTDDGDGMNLWDVNEGRLLTTLALSSKRDDDDTIGQFGIGFGQAVGKARTTVRSGNCQMFFDWKNNGIVIERTEIDEDVDGFEVHLDYYDDEVPDSDDSKWSMYRNDLEGRFMYIEIVHDAEVWLNGDRISDMTPVKKYQYRDYTEKETDLAYYALKPSSNSKYMDVYSMGIRVGYEEGNGLDGYVITKKNLGLNTARNEILSGCDVWSQIEEELSEIRVDLLSNLPEEDMSDYSRAGIVKLIREGHEDMQDKPVLKQANGQHISYNKVLSSKDVMFAGNGDLAADKLIERGKTVLHVDDKAVTELLDARDNAGLELPPQKDVTAVARALGICNGFEVIEDHSEWPRKGMLIAQALNTNLADYLGVPEREIKYGRDESARAWTNGVDYIVLTDSIFESSRSYCQAISIWRVLCHEYAHDSDSKGTDQHGDRFHEKFRRYIDRSEDMITKFIDESEKKGFWDNITDWCGGERPAWHNETRPS